MSHHRPRPTPRPWAEFWPQQRKSATNLVLLKMVIAWCLIIIEMVARLLIIFTATCSVGAAWSGPLVKRAVYLQAG